MITDDRESTEVVVEKNKIKRKIHKSMKKASLGKYGKGGLEKEEWLDVEVWRRRCDTNSLCTFIYRTRQQWQ